jgi:proliferating cell nuclear antigen
MNISIAQDTKSDIFCSIFQHIKLFSENITISFHQDRMYVQSMDHARISIFEIIIQHDWFDEYKLETAGSLCLGVNANLLFKILNAREKTQTIVFELGEDDADTLLIHFKSENKAIFDKHFEMPLLNIDEELMAIPEMDSHAELTIPSANFATLINQLSIFGDTLHVDCSEETILFYSKSSDLGKMMVEVNIDDLSAFSINEGAVLNLSFSLRNLHNICAYSKLCKEIEIKWIDHFPMQVIYPIDDKAQIKFYLAPKVDDE